MNKRQQEIFDELNRTFIARKRLKELLNEHKKKFGYIPPQYFEAYKNLQKDDDEYIFKSLKKTSKIIYKRELRANNK